MIYKSVISILFCFFTGCVFKIEVASPKSKLERQVLGYKPLVPKDQIRKIVKRSSVKGSLSIEQCQAMREYLKPQIISSMKKGILGEGKSGFVEIVNSKFSGYVLDPIETSIFEDLLEDENSIRKRLSEIDRSKPSRYSYSYESDIWVETTKGWNKS